MASSRLPRSLPLVGIVTSPIEMVTRCGAALVVVAMLGSTGALGAASGGPPPPPGVESLNQGERGRLAAGEPVVLARREAERWVRALVRIEAEPEALWEVMTACPRAPEFVPGLSSCRVIESEEHAALVDHRARPFLFLPEMAYAFREHREPFRSIRFRRVSGSLKQMEGRWDLRRQGARRTVVWYTVFLDPGSVPATTSARRFQARGAVRQQAVNALLVSAFRAGVSPPALARLYARRSRRRGATGRAWSPD